MLEAVVVVVDAVEVVPQPRPAVAAHEALLVVVVRPRQDRVRLDQLGAGVTRVYSRDIYCSSIIFQVILKNILI